MCWFRAIRILVLLTIQAAAAEAPRRILIIHSFGRDFAPFHEVASEFRTQLAQLGTEPVEVVEASLEMARFDGPDRDRPLLEYLRAIFPESRPDLIVPIGGPAALFGVRHRDALFPGVPLLVVGVDRRRLAEIQLGSESAAITVNVEARQLIDNILQVRPDTREVFVVMGQASLERFWAEELRREWSAAFSHLTFHWLSDQPLESLRGSVARLPPKSAVFFGILNRDAAGVPHEAETGLRSIHEAANAPIFGYGSHQLGLGIVGGRLLTMRRAGAEAARAARRLLAGEAISRIQIEPIGADAPAYDARELRRWGIRVASLPPGSTVLFQAPSLWETHRRTVLIAVAVILLQSGLIVLLLAARRRAAESEASLGLAAESARLGVWERDLATDEIKATPQWRNLLGFSSDDPVTLAKLLERAHPADAPRLREILDQAGRVGGRYEIEFRVVLPEGRIRWIQSIGQAVAEAGGQRMRTRGVSLDITSRKGMEAETSRHRAELAHLSRVSSLGILSASLAHELNQPLGIILSNAQAAQRLLRRSPAEIGELQAILADIVAEDRRAGEVIQRLRALLQRGEARRHPFEVHECIEDVLQLTRSDLLTRGVLVERHFAPGLPPVLADRIQMQQVFLNLILNACDAMDGVPSGERVLTVSTEQLGDVIRASIQDSGTGLPGDPEQLFTPFHTTKPQGLGMGLPICRTILQAHEGKVWAEANPKRGAIFFVTLPLPA